MKNFNQMEDYYRGNMSAELKLQFEHSLETDESLKAEFETYSASQNLIDYIVGKDLSNKLSELDKKQGAAFEGNGSEGLNSQYAKGHETGRIVPLNPNSEVNFVKSKSKPLFSSILKLRIAASVLILVTVCISAFYFLRSNDFSSITEQNISYLELGQMRGSNISQKYKDLIQFQADGNYHNANVLIDDLMASEPTTYDYLLYFKGQNNFRLKKFAIAEKQFGEVIDILSPKYLEQAQLMRVFTAVETKNYKLAKSRIEQLERLPNYSYKEVIAKVKTELPKE